MKDETPSPAQAVTFRQHLQDELTKRCRANPKYSLRALARSLGVEPSALSQILNNKRPLTRKMKLRLGSGLGLSVREIDRIPTDESDRRAPEFQQMSLDEFALISDWYHYAILELTYLTDFKGDHAWIARRLGITRSEVNFAVERLLRLKLLAIDAEGRWRDLSAEGSLSHLTPGMSSAAARKYQIQLLELSKNAVEEVDVKSRSHTSAAFCFNPEDLEAAVAEIAAFRRQFAAKFQPRGLAEEVYQIQISFFPLTKPILKKETP